MKKILFRKKSLAHIKDEINESESLRRDLTLKDLTAFGIAAIVGAGIFSTIGNAAADGGPAISLLLLAYTNRFLTLANLIRDLHAKYKQSLDQLIPGQIANLRYRMVLIRNMQAFGVSSLLLCVLSMFALFFGWQEAGMWIFGVGLILMAI